jgi:DNA-directed RNA polymerase subunit beta'
VILGHLVPAGTGFQMHQDAEVRVHPSTLEAMGIHQEVREPVEAVDAAAK